VAFLHQDNASHLQINSASLGFSMRLLAILWLVVAVIQFATAQSAAAEPRKVQVLCSLVPLASWTLNVVGDLATVETLLPADVGPHDFNFRPRDLKRIKSADLIVINGLGIEEWLGKVLRSNAGDLTNKLVRTGEGLDAEYIYHLPELVLDPKNRKKDGHSHAHDHIGAGEQPNPHVWLDPVFARHGVSNILHGLVRIDPQNAEGYRRNARIYLDRLQKLDDEARSVVDGLTEKSLVTFHDAFPYFTRRYGLELVGVIEEVPGVDPSPKYLSELLKVVRSRRVKALFTEPQFSPKLANRLARDLGIGIGELDVMETGTVAAEFYEQGIRRNLQSLQKSLN